MTAVQSLLSRGLAPLEQGLPHTFTAEGLAGAYACLLETSSLGNEPGVAGSRIQQTATLSFRRSIPYTPVAGGIITVDGQPWRIELPVLSDIKWDLQLISVDE